MATTFGKLAEIWLEEVSRQFTSATLRNYRGSVNRLLEHDPTAANRAINRLDIIRWRDAMADSGMNIQSVNRHTKAVKACLRWGTLLGLGHPEVELRRIALPLPPRRELVYTAEESSRVLAAAMFDPPIYAILRICRDTGMRLSEALHLQWRDVGDGSVRITPKEGWSPKTAAGVREIPAPELVEWLLGAYRSSLRFKGETDWVCQMRPGRPWTKRVHDRLQTVMRQAGLEGKRKPTHSFRHALASDLIEAGVPITSAQRMLGHANPTILLQHYARA